MENQELIKAVESWNLENAKRAEAERTIQLALAAYQAEVQAHEKTKAAFTEYREAYKREASKKIDATERPTLTEGQIKKALETSKA